jgi:hypothetical protein
MGIRLKTGCKFTKNRVEGTFKFLFYKTDKGNEKSCTFAASKFNV